MISTWARGGGSFEAGAWGGREGEGGKGEAGVRGEGGGRWSSSWGSFGGRDKGVRLAFADRDDAFELGGAEAITAGLDAIRALVSALMAVVIHTKSRGFDVLDVGEVEAQAARSHHHEEEGGGGRQPCPSSPREKTP